ncbi:MAG: hypothetical protein GF353_11535 [Candidatus Lokiarchaeota archaeon]|nr:hypothetical protein [Candidatus Lokiarchaeota archaeon]
MELRKIKRIKEDLNELKESFEVVIYGSFVEGGMRPNSDLDIAVITRSNNKEKNKKIQMELFGIASLKYDIRIFELLPIYIQIAIVNNYRVLFGDILEISEYFRQFRKKWDDCKERILSNQFKSVKERLKLLKSF